MNLLNVNSRAHYGEGAVRAWLKHQRKLARTLLTPTNCLMSDADAVESPLKSPPEVSKASVESTEKAKKESHEMPVGGWLSRNIKYFSLIILVAQNSALVLTLRYSRVSTDGKKLYLSSTAVVLTELVKFIICLSVLFHNSKYNVRMTMNLLYVEIIEKITETAKVSVPSILYTIQNNLLFVALSYLNAVTFQVTYQLKILTTALFSVFLLKKSLTGLKWLSLVILMIAVVLVQWPSDSNNATSFGDYISLVGLGAVLLACISSGFSGVYIEMILKQSDTSMWIRNIQLSLLSFFVGVFGICVTDWKAIREDGFFQGYTYIVFLVILLQALGGLIVAVVMKYADNILKGFATSISIVLSSVISFFVLNDLKPSWHFLTGTMLVLTATFMYSKAPAKHPQLPLAEAPKNHKS